MKTVAYLSALLLFALPGFTYSQNNTLFDDSRVSSVYIDISTDSLAVIMTDVLSDHYFKAQFIFDDGQGNDTLQDVGFRLRGNTSRYAQKKSFKISFNEYVSGRKYQGVKKINLNAQHNDPTMIREKLFYDLWKKAGMKERRTSFVKLYVNQVYYGLYTNLEEMEKEWVSRVYAENSGNLYKCTYPADLQYLGENQQTYKDLTNTSVTGGRVYELQTNKTDDDYTGLVTLIHTLHLPYDTLFADTVSKYIDVDEYLKSLAMDVATGNWDDYAYNMNNYYLYDNPANGQFDYIAYDCDNTFGVDWMGINWATRNSLDWINHDAPRPLAEKLLSVPVFFAKYKLYLDTIARNIINPDTIFAHIDALKLLITPAAEADSLRRLDYGYTMIDFNNGFIQAVDSHTPWGIKPFLTARKQAILDQLHSSSVNEMEKPISEITISPNPATDVITIQLAALPVHKMRCRIMDIYGKTIKAFTWNADKADYRISLNDMPAGIYILRLQSADRNITAKFVKN